MVRVNQNSLLVAVNCRNHLVQSLRLGTLSEPEVCILKDSNPLVFLPPAQLAIVVDLVMHGGQILEALVLLKESDTAVLNAEANLRLLIVGFLSKHVLELAQLVALGSE